MNFAGQHRRRIAVLIVAAATTTVIYFTRDDPAPKRVATFHIGTPDPTNDVSHGTEPSTGNTSTANTNIDSTTTTTTTSSTTSLHITGCTITPLACPGALDQPIGDGPLPATDKPVDGHLGLNAWDSLMNNETRTSTLEEDLNNPAYSDLPLNDAITVAQIGAELVVGEHTGIGIEKWPDYFHITLVDGTPLLQVRICTDFTLLTSSAATAPALGGDMAIVRTAWTANCPNGADFNTTEQIQVSYYALQSTPDGWKPVRAVSRYENLAA